MSPGRAGEDVRQRSTKDEDALSNPQALLHSSAWRQQEVQQEQPAPPHRNFYVSHPLTFPIEKLWTSQRGSVVEH